MALFTSRWLPVLLFTLFSTAWAADKNLIPTSPSSSFPACGLSCSTLTSAQDSCTASPDQASWFSCFCQSALLTSLKSTGSVCANCGASDQALLSTWYNNYCNSGGTDTGASNSNGAGTPVASTAPSGTSAAASSSASPGSATNQGWWPTHYRWVIMVIVLIVGFSIIAAVGVYLKRRYDAKRPGLYHGESEAPNRGSGVFSPAPAPAWASPAPAQSMASSSRTDMTPKAVPVTGARSKLQRPF